MAKIFVIYSNDQGMKPEAFLDAGEAHDRASYVTDSTYIEPEFAIEYHDGKYYNWLNIGCKIKSRFVAPLGSIVKN